MKTLIKKPELLVEDFVKSIDIKDCARFSDIYPKVGKYVSGYDRGLNSIVKEIEESFRPELFSMPTLAKITHKKYKYVIIDGNNRITALKRIWKSGLINAKVLENQSPNEQAQLYLDLNEKRGNVSFKERFKARVFMEDEDAIQIVKTCMKYQVSIPDVIPTGIVSTIGLHDLHTCHKNGTLDRVLNTLMNGFEEFVSDESQSKYILHRPSLRVMNNFYRLFPDSSNVDHLVNRLQSKRLRTDEWLITPIELITQLKQNQAMGGNGVPVVLDIYNYTLNGSSRLTPTVNLWKYTK